MDSRDISTNILQGTDCFTDTDTLIPAWVSNHMFNKMWDKITYPFPNFNDCTVEVWEWISNFTPQITGLWLLIHAAIEVKPC